MCRRPRPASGIRAAARSAPALPSKKLAFAASDAPEAQAALQRLRTLYGSTDPRKADVIAALGGVV